MLGRIGRLLLAAFVTEFGGAIIEAGRSWVDRKLNPAPPPPAPPPATEGEQG